MTIRRVIEAGALGGATILSLASCKALPANPITDLLSNAKNQACDSVFAPTQKTCDTEIGSGIPDPGQIIGRASRRASDGRLDTIAPNALRDTRAFLDALDKAGIVTRLLEIKNLFRDPEGVPDYIELRGTKAEKVEAVTDIVNAARAKKIQVYFELGPGSALGPPSCADVNKNALCIGFDALSPDPMLFPSPEGTAPNNPTDHFAVFAQLFSSDLEGKVQADKVFIYHAKPTDEVDMILSGIKLLKDGGELVYVFDSDRGDSEDLIIRLQQIDRSLQRKDFSPGVSTVGKLNEKYGYHELDFREDTKVRPSSAFVGDGNPDFKKQFIVFRKSPQPKFTHNSHRNSPIIAELAPLAIQHMARKAHQNDDLVIAANRVAQRQLAERGRAKSNLLIKRTVFQGSPQNSPVQLI